MKLVVSVLLLTILSISTTNGSIVAIVDTGVDYKHKDLLANMWSNLDEMLYGDDTLDNDENGYFNDFHGWNMAEKNNKVFDFKYQNIVSDDVVRFYKIIALSKMGQYTEEDVRWYREVSQNQRFMNDVAFSGGYSHGTHVAGIARKNNDSISLLTIKYIGTDYKSVLARALSTIGTDVKPIDTKKESEEIIANFLKTLDLTDFKNFLTNQAINSAVRLQEVAKYVDDKKVRVVNGSFGLGFKRAFQVVVGIFIKIYGVYPTQEQAIELTDHFLSQSIMFDGIAVGDAPETLFVFAAGNDGLNNDIFKDSPANARTNNIISVAATLYNRELAEFSNFGPTTVDIAAPGVNIESAAPGNKLLYMSGTSQAAPYVTNVASKIFDVNKELAPTMVRSIMMDTVDKKSFLTGIIKSGGIVNEQRAIYAATLMKQYGFTYADAIRTSLTVVKTKEVEKGHLYMPESTPFMNFIVPRPSTL